MGKRYVPPFLRSPEDDLVLTEALPPEDQLAGRFERTKLAAAANPECKPAASRQAQGKDKLPPAEAGSFLAELR